MDPPILKKCHADFIYTKIFQAILKKDSVMTLTYINAHEDIHAVCNSTKMTYLHVIMGTALPITEKKFVPIVYQFSNAGIDLDANDGTGVSPIKLAIKNSLLDLMIALIKCGATMDPEADEVIFERLVGPSMYELNSWYRKFSPGFWDAVANDKAFKVNILVKAWCRVNISRNGKSLLEYAKECNACDKVIKMLRDNESTIDLAHAIIAGDEARVRHILLHYRVNIETKDMLHRENYFAPFTPLTLYDAAELYQHRHLLPLLANIKDNIHLYSSPHLSSDSSQVDSVVCVVL